MNTKKVLASALLGCALTTANMAAQATIVLDHWDFDFTGIDGLGATTVNNVGEITFFGAARAETDLTGPTPGLYGTTDGFLAATQFIDATSGSFIPGSNLNNTYEMTFDFSLTSQNTAGPPVNTFFHLAHNDPNALNDGILDVYIDNFSNNNPPDCQAGTNSASACYTDGTKIASFYVRAGDGGVFNAATLDGSDDATFELFDGLAGVLFRDGVDLIQAALDGDLILLAFSNSNFDADPDETGTIGNYQPGVFSGLCGNQSAETPVFCAEEDGSIALGAIPEPSLVALMGIGLLGLGAGTLRRHKKG